MPSVKFIKTILILFIIVLIGAIAYLGNYIYSNVWLLQTSESLNPESNVQVRSFGLNEPVLEDLFFDGVLYFTADVKDDENKFYPQTYTHSFLDSSITQYNTAPSRSFARFDENTDIFISYVTDSDDPDLIDILSFNSSSSEYQYIEGNDGFNEVDLAVSPNKEFYAYSYQKAEDIDEILIENWSVALFSFSGGLVTEIEAAAEPLFINDGQDLLYLKTDGIYRYNIATEESVVVSKIYTELSRAEGYAVTSNDRVLIFTSPNLNLISVQKLNSDFKAVEIGSIVSPGTRYRYPVISPDDEYYVVMAAKDKDFGDAGYQRIDAEIRSIMNSQVLDVINFEGFSPTSVLLHQWLNQ